MMCKHGPGSETQGQGGRAGDGRTGDGFYFVGRGSSRDLPHLADLQGWVNEADTCVSYLPDQCLGSHNHQTR